jgi:hypothetical protein
MTDIEELERDRNRLKKVCFMTISPVFFRIYAVFSCFLFFFDFLQYYTTVKKKP